MTRKLLVTSVGSGIGHAILAALRYSEAPLYVVGMNSAAFNAGLRAVELAKDIARLRELRDGLRERMERSPFTDGERLTHSLETAYRKMWARYCDREHEQTGSIEVGEEHDVGHA